MCVCLAYINRSDQLIIYFVYILKKNLLRLYLIFYSFNFGCCGGHHLKDVKLIQTKNCLQPKLFVLSSKEIETLIYIRGKNHHKENQVPIVPW